MIKNKMNKKKKIVTAIIVSIVSLSLIGAGIYTAMVISFNQKLVSKLPLVSNLDENGNSFQMSELGDDVAIVYMTTDISPEGLAAVYEAMGVSAEGNVGVKISTGENGSNYLRPELIGDFVNSVGGTIIECNTAYGGNRSESAMHWQLIRDHGYYDMAPCDIMDEDGSMAIPVPNGTYITENLVGTHLENYDSIIVLSHFKGHGMAGFGGALKNISIGIASAEGKLNIHTGGEGGSSIYGEQDKFLYSMAEAGQAVSEYMDGNMVYINVMNRLSIGCDCEENPPEPDMHDVGILASTDPVALDQACVDLVYAAEDGQSLIDTIESRNGIMTIKRAAEIGLGTRSYYIVNIDSEDYQNGVIPGVEPSTNDDSSNASNGNTYYFCDLALMNMLRKSDVFEI